MTEDITPKEKEVEKSQKQEWESPEILDFPINSRTQNNASGPSLSDGGPTFILDYTS